MWFVCDNCRHLFFLQPEDKAPFSEGICPECHSGVLVSGKIEPKIYHFTDIENLPSIRKHGLLSWKKLKERGIPHTPASNNLSRQLDSRHNLEDYVRLCLGQYHPMAEKAVQENRIKSIAWLEIDSSVIRWRSTRFSNDNATSNRFIIDSDPQTAFDSTSSQAEILIEGGLSPKWITFPGEKEIDTFDDIPF